METPMANDFRPHLTIPETEVEHVPYKPTGRSKDRGIDRHEHGEKLSSGLQDIVSAYAKFQGGDSLNDEDIRLFEVILPEGEKLSNKTLRDFLAQEGMTINSIRDERHATVSSSRDKFDSLQNRVGNYRDNKKSNKRFQFIDEFRFPDPLEKQSKSLRELWINRIGNERLDVEIREELLLPLIGEDGQANAERNLIAKIQQHEGKLMTEPYKLSDGTPIIRAEIPINNLREISTDTVVCRVVPTAFYTTAPAYTMDAQVPISLDTTVEKARII
jgi:hypothetical protein